MFYTSPKTITNPIQELRQIAPRRALTYDDAKQIAEQQAIRLVDFWGETSGAVDTRHIEELPRIRIEVEKQLRHSGHTRWDNGWVLAISAEESFTRRRFSIAHELYHAITAGWEGLRYQNMTPKQIEQLCNHFAACLLMPRASLRQAWVGGVQHPADLADHFQVSLTAVCVRLKTLRLPIRDLSAMQQRGFARMIHTENTELPWGEGSVTLPHTYYACRR